MSVTLLAVNVATDVVVPIVAVVALVAINGVFVAAEFSLVASRRSRIDALAAEGNRAARPARHHARIDRSRDVRRARDRPLAV